METLLIQDLGQLDLVLEQTKQESLSFLGAVDTIPTTTATRELPVRPLHKNGIGALSALRDFQEKYRSLIVSSTGPRYWGYVTGGATPASIMGDWLASVYDQNTQNTDGNGDNSALIELETIGLLRELLHLPHDFFGGFVTGATMSNFSCLAVARQWLGKEFHVDIARAGISDAAKMTVLSATAHSSSIKALAMLGMGSSNIVRVKTLEGNKEAMDIRSLEDEIKKLNGLPFILVSSAGTVNSGDFDDFTAILALRDHHNFWWHIDAAFGAFASCSPQYQHLVKNWEHADSITVDAHKWLNVPYENAIFLIREKYLKLQAETFQNSNAPYLGNTQKSFNYLNLLPENSRRFKALPVWFSLVAYGKEGFRALVENNIHLAKQFGGQIDAHNQLELLAPVRLNIVSFTLKDADSATIDKFLTLLNGRGRVFMTPSVFKGRKGIRAALVNWRTGEKDVALVMKEIEQVLLQLN